MNKHSTFNIKSLNLHDRVNLRFIRLKSKRLIVGIYETRKTMNVIVESSLMNKLSVGNVGHDADA